MRVRGALSPVLVVQTRGESAWIQRESGDPEKVRRETLVWHGGSIPAGLNSPAERIGWLEKQFQDLFDESSSVEVGELWERVLSGGPPRLLSLPELLSQLGSECREGALVIALELNRNCFKRNPEGYAAYSQEERREREARKFAPWTPLWREARLKLFQEVEANSPEELPSGPEWDDICRILVRLATASEKGGLPGRESQFLEDALGTAVYRPVLEAARVLKKWGVWGENESLEAHREGLPLTHSKEQLETALQVATGDHAARGNDQNRPIFSNFGWVAVDEESTLDVDDALWAEDEGHGTIRIHVAIADPAEWIVPDSPLWNEAKGRGASLYLPTQVVGMFPDSIATEFCSLVQGKPRLALHFSWRIDAFGQVDEFDVKEAVIVLRERASYEEVDEAMAQGNRPDWKLLCEAASRMRTRRGNAGGLLLRQAEWKCLVKDQETIQIKAFDPYSSARELVSELMIATGILSGEYCHKNGIPTIYRSQQPPDEEPDISVEDLSDASELYDLFRTMKRAELTVSPAPHYMLGARSYTQVSSPLRRFCDLVVHYQLKAFLRRGVPHWDSKTIWDEIEGVDGNVRARLKVERESHRYWVLSRLASMRGQRVRGQVIRRLGKRFLVALSDYGVREACELPSHIEVGTNLPILIQDADARENRLVLGKG